MTLSSGKLLRLDLTDKELRDETKMSEVKKSVWELRQKQKAQLLSRWMNRQTFNRFSVMTNGASKNIMSRTFENHEEVKNSAHD